MARPKSGTRKLELPLTPDSKLPRIGGAVIFAMLAAAGTAVSNMCCDHSVLGLIEADTPSGLTPPIPTATQPGYAAGPFLLSPLGDILERRLIGVQFMTLSAALALAAVAPNGPLLLAASLLIGVCATVAQQIVSLAAHFVVRERLGASVGTILAGIVTGTLLSGTLAGFVAAHAGWRGMLWLGVPMALSTGALMPSSLPRSLPHSRLSHASLLGLQQHLWRDFRALRLDTATQALIFAAFTMFWTILSFGAAGSAVATFSWQVEAWRGAVAIGIVVGLAANVLQAEDMIRSKRDPIKAYRQM